MSNLLASVSSHWFIFFQKYKKVMFLCCLQATLPFWKPIEANSCQQKIPAQLVHHWCWDFYWTTSELHIDNLFLEVIFWTRCLFKPKPEGGGYVSFLLDVLSGILANILFPGKFWWFQKSAVKKSSNTQKHRELQLTVFLGFQAACVLSGIFWADKPFWRGF